MEESGQNLKNKNMATVIILLLLLLMLLTYYFLPDPHRRDGRKVKQKAQFNSIQACNELLNHEINGYPPSGALDLVDQPYCGAMKLFESIMGQDLLGFNKESVFRSDGMNQDGTIKLYTKESEAYDPNVRIGPLLPIENANAYRLNEIYEDIGSFKGNNYVICDVFSKKRKSGKRTGMPILYYKADTSKTAHDVNLPDNTENSYNYKDNHALLSLGVPGKLNIKHPLFINPKIFYEMTKDRNVNTKSKPVREDSFILISAGKDGLYGTPDDICNFEWKYRE